MKVGLFGGTFNPPHNAHLELAKAFLNEFKLDKLYICPANIPYHKASAIPLDAQHRLNMCRLAFKDLPNDKVIISDMEIARGGNTYTVDTVNEILSIHPNCSKVYVLCGTDMIRSLPGWYKADELFEKSIFVHAKRKGIGSCDLPSINILTLNAEEMELSSSEIRLKPRDYKEYLNKDVYNYINKNLLYHIDKEYDIDKLKDYAKTHEKESRYSHTLGVEKCALKLKEHTAPQLSDNLVSACAILHDCTKNCALCDHFVLFSELDKPLGTEDLSSEKLFHSRSGAILARRMFDASDAMYNAIWRHTVGSENMTVLDKIIFLADFIEDTRIFDECVRLRNIYYNVLKCADSLIKRLLNLDKCVKIAFELTVEELRSKGLKPHSETLRALENIKKEIVEYEKIFANI